LISFLSPCVLPLVPAYLGQLTAVAVAGASAATLPSRWLALSNAAAYVLGFGAVFSILGLTATFAGGALFDVLPGLRQLGGAILIVFGLSLAGIIRIPILERTWRPLDAGAATAIAERRGTMALATAGSSGGIATVARGDQLGQRLAGATGLAGSFGLGAIFAVGWTPCIGVILGGILTLAASTGGKIEGALLLLGYTLGLGLPFLVLGALYDRAPALLRPLTRHGQLTSLIGGLLVVAIGVAMLFDWLALLPRYFNFLTGV
jgi:cytochrome c-type biogenesis protein